MKKGTTFRSLIFVVIAMMLSKIVISVIYLGYRVIDANAKGLLPMDSELLRADWQAVLANSVYGNIALGVLCLIYYLIVRKKITINVEKKVLPRLSFVHWGVFALAFGFFFRITLSFAVYFLSESGLIGTDIQTVETSTKLWEYILQMLLMAVLVPIYEELIFRKTFVNDLLNVYNQKTALIIALIGFVVLHSGLNIVFSMALGVISLYTYLKYGNILLNIVIHAAFNFAGATDVPFVDVFPEIVYVFYGLSIIIVACYSFVYIKKRRITRKTDT